MGTRFRALAAVAIIAAATLAAVATAPRASASTRVSTRALLRDLSVAPEHSAGYARDKFRLWVDADHDGCNTRQEVLISEAVRKPRIGSSCRLSGGRWYSRYDGVTVTDSSALDIDHLVPLAEAWRSGARGWSAGTRERYANDLGYGPDLVAVTAHANRSKGDDEPSAYLPPRKAFDCTYEAWWVAVKWRWQLHVDSSEKAWLRTHLAACGWPSVARPGRPKIVRASTPGGSPTGSSVSGARIVAIYFNPPGADTGSNTSLNAEWVRIKNTTASRKTLTGWTLRDAASHVYRFPAFTLAAGAYVKVHTGFGSNSAYHLFWRSGTYIWNNSGDTARLRNAAGALVDRCSYTSAADPKATC
jgi:hypothetical protein